MKYFTQKELKKLFRTIEKDKDNPYWLRNLTMIEVGYLCALRVGEISNLTLENFNQQAGEMYCNRLKKSQSNTIRLDSERIKLLKRYIREYKITDSQEPLFLSKKKGAISERQIQRIMAAYCKAAKLPEEKSHPHALKHSIAVHLAESGVDIKDLQFYLGHKNIQNTLVYFQYTTSQQEIFYENLRKNSQIVT